MSRVCTVCAHSERTAIDSALVEGNESYRGIAKRFGASAPAVLRHRAHISKTLTVAKEATEATRADTLLGKLAELEAQLSRALAQAEQQKDYRAVFSGVREMCALVRLLGEVR